MIDYMIQLLTTVPGFFANILFLIITVSVVWGIRTDNTEGLFDFSAILLFFTVVLLLFSDSILSEKYLVKFQAIELELDKDHSVADLRKYYSSKKGSEIPYKMILTYTDRDKVETQIEYNVDISYNKAETLDIISTGNLTSLKLLNEDQVFYENRHLLNL